MAGTKTSRPQGADPRPTRDQLVEVAAAAFNAAGFHGTDTNKIARAAGFAPQTFYRHFADKLDIFLAVYERWHVEERDALAKITRSADADREVARVLVAHHARWAGFRRSLRVLAKDNAEVRRARAFSLERQLQHLAKFRGNAGRGRAELLAGILDLERLCEAIVDGEFDDLAVEPEAAIAQVAAAVRRSRGDDARA